MWKQEDEGTMKALVEKVLKEEGREYGDIKIVIGMHTTHHQDTSVSIVFKNVPIWNGRGERLCSIHFKGMPTGCGLVVMHGFYYFRDNSNLMEGVVKRLMRFYHEDGCSILASIGNSEWEKCPFLEKLNFARISEYWNMAHKGSQDKQSVWISHAKSIIRDENGSIKPK